MDAPMADAMMLPSASGVSSTRSSPNLSYSPAVALKTTTESPMSSPITNTRSSRAISCAIASVMASIIVIFRAMFSRSPLFLCPDVIRQFRSIRIRALLGEFHRFIDFLSNLLGDFIFGFVSEQLLVAEDSLKQHQWVPLLPRLHFFLRPILGGIDFRVPVPSVGLALYESRPVARACACNRLRRCVVHSQHVVPIHAHSREAMRFRAVRQILERRLQTQRHGLGP